MANELLPFQTHAEFQQAHERLLALADEGSEAIGSEDDERGRLIDVLDEIRSFMRRGSEGGAYLDEPRERRACQSLLDYWASQCYSHQLDIPRPLLAPHDASLLPTLADDACAYVGLDAFGEADARHFFGRDDQVAALVERLRHERLVVVTGASGSGKSSLVLAGVVPALKRGTVEGSATWRYLPTLVPGVAPLQHLALAIAPAVGVVEADRAAWVEAQAAAMRSDPLHAARLLAGDARPAVVIVDQFEEALTLRTEQTSVDYIAFVANLRALVEADAPPHRLILTMRKDVEPQLAREYPDLNRLYGAAAFPVYSMESTRLREAIEKPAAQAGLKFQDGVVDELIKSVVGEDASLPLLQFSLMALWERRKGNLVTREAYREVGSPRHAMAEAARRLYDALPREQQLAAQRVFVALSRQGEGASVFRNRATRRLLHGVADPNNVDAVLDKFAQARLVRVTRVNDDPLDDVAEVAHESLLRNWDLLDRIFAEQRVERERRAFLRKQAEKWREAGFDQAFLLSGLALQQANDEFKADAVTQLEREFMAASDAAEQARLRAQAEEEERRVAVETARAEVAEQRAEVERASAEAARRLAEERDVANKRIAVRLRIAMVAALVAVGFAGVAAFAWDRAKRAVEGAETRLLALNAKLLSETDSELSVLLAAEAVRRQPSMMSRMAAVVLDATQFRRAAVRLPASQVGEAESLALDPTGGRLLIANGEGVTEWALQAGGGASVARKLAWDAKPQEVNLVAYSPDGQLVAAATDLGVTLWSGSGGATAVHLPGTEAILRFSFSADGRMLGAISKDQNLVKVWSLPEGELLLSYRPQDESGDKDIFSVIFSANADKFIAVEAPDPSTTKMRLFVHAITDRHIDPKPTQVLMQACPDFDFSFAAGGNRVGLSLNPKVCSFDVRRLAEGDAATSSTPAPESGDVSDIAISPDGRFVVRLLGRINEAQVANLATGELWRLQGAFDLLSSTSYEGRLALSSNGERLAIKARDGSIRIFDLTQSGGSAVSSRWISPDEKLVVVPASDGLHDSFELRDFETGRLLRRLDPEAKYKTIRDFALSGDGKQLLARASRPNDDKPMSLLGFEIGSNAAPVEHRVDDILAWDHDLFLVQEGAEWLLYLGAANQPVYRMPSPTGAEPASRRAPKSDSLQFGNKRLFAVQTYSPAAIKVQLFAIDGATARLLHTIERPVTERVDIAFQGGGRALLLSNGRRTEVWDSKTAASGPAFVLADVLPRNVFLGIDSTLVIVRRPGKPWEVRDLMAAGAVLETVPADFHVDASASYAWTPLENGRGIQVKNLADRAAPPLVIEGEDARPEFSRSGGVLAVKIPRENRLRIYRLPSTTPVFEADMAAFEGSKLTESGRYIQYGDGRLIPTDAQGLVQSARGRIKRDIDDSDRCRALEDEAACARQRAAAPTAASTSR